MSDTPKTTAMYRYCYSRDRKIARTRVFRDMYAQAEELEKQLTAKDERIDRLESILEHALVGCKIATLLPCDNTWTDEYVQEIESFLHEGKTKNSEQERTGR